MIKNQSIATGPGGENDLPTGGAEALRKDQSTVLPHDRQTTGAKVLITSSDQIAVRKEVVSYRDEGL